MSYQALARKWRPRQFEDLVGQAYVVQALTHALANNKLHHALLFSGTRGVGKTTLARIIAKCLNCDKATSTTATPCTGEDACAACREVDEGRFVDLIEVDAASRTGVDDMRELMDNVHYAPTRGRTKVYLIDEVHMLSKSSFNALLKTLEEPPPRVQFLFATTEPEKLPITILSRCLHFPLQRITVGAIAQQLEHILQMEQLTGEPDALTELAKAADGSMRDALSLLDQALAFGHDQVNTGQVREMLGAVGHQQIEHLLRAIAAQDAQQSIEGLDAAYTQGVEIRHLLETMASAWQAIALAQQVPDYADEALWSELGQALNPADVQIFYDITLGGLRDLAYAPDPLVGARMTILRLLAFTPLATQDLPPTQTSAPQQSPKAKPVTSQTAAPQPAAKPVAKPAKPAVAPVPKAQLRAALNPDADIEQLVTTPAAAPKQAKPTPVKAAQPEVNQPNIEPRAEQPAEIAPPEAQAVTTPEPPVVAPQPGEPIVQPKIDQSEEVAAAAAPVETPPLPQTQAPQAAPAIEPAAADISPPAELAPEQPPAQPAETVVTTQQAQSWSDMVEQLGLSAMAKQLAKHCDCPDIHADPLILALPYDEKWLASDRNQQALAKAVGEYRGLGRPAAIKVTYQEQASAHRPVAQDEQAARQRQQAAVEAIENDPNVQYMQKHLGATLQKDTIKPLSKN